MSTSTLPSKAETPTEPGFYPGTTMADYLKWNVASCSRLSDLEVSPARCRWNIDHPDDDDSDNLILGSAIHKAILEPDSFSAAYFKLPGDDRRLKEVKAAIEQAEARGFIPLRPKDWTKCAQMRDAVWGHAAAKKILQAANLVEISGVASLPAGIDCSQLFKLRPDIIAESIGVHADIKSCEDARPEPFARSILNYGYHRTGGMYGRALKTLGRDISTYVCIALTKSEPYEVAVYEVAARALEVGLNEGLRLLSVYHECERTKAWPALSPDVQLIDLPEWFHRRLEMEGAA